MWQRKEIGSGGWVSGDKGCCHLGRWGLIAPEVWRRDCGPLIPSSLHSAHFLVLLLNFLAFVLFMMHPEYIMNFSWTLCHSLESWDRKGSRDDRQTRVIGEIWIETFHCAST